MNGERFGQQRVQNRADFLRDARGQNHEGFRRVLKTGVKRIHAQCVVAEKEVVLKVFHIGRLCLRLTPRQNPTRNPWRVKTT